MDSDEEYYKLSAKSPVGFAIILNITEFEEATTHHNDPMPESYIIAAWLERAFRTIGFEPFTYTDLRADEICNLCRDLSEDKEALEKHDAFAMVIMSHGIAGHIMGIDGAVKLEDIFQFFNEDNCEGLRGKPKLFFIEACRSENVDASIPIWKYKALTNQDWHDFKHQEIPEYDGSDVDSTPVDEWCMEYAREKQDDEEDDVGDRAEDSEDEYVTREQMAERESITIYNRNNLTKDQIMNLTPEEFIKEFFPDADKKREPEPEPVSQPAPKKKEPEPEPEHEKPKPKCGEFVFDAQTRNRVCQLPPPEPDMLIHYASAYGYRAWAYKTNVEKSQTDYGKALAKMIEKEGWKHDIHTLLTIVNQTIAEEVFSDSKGTEHRQIPSLCHQLSKKLKFHDHRKDLEIPPRIPPP